jgi:hypothetical protein
MGGSNPSDLMPALSDWQVKEDSERLIASGFWMMEMKGCIYYNLNAS